MRIGRQLSIDNASVETEFRGTFNDNESPPGRQVAEVIRNRLASRQDCKLGEVYPRSFYGWECDLQYEGRRYLIVVQLGDCVSVSISQVGVLNWLFGKRKAEVAIDGIAELVCDVLQGMTRSTIKIEKAAFELSF